MALELRWLPKCRDKFRFTGKGDAMTKSRSRPAIRYSVHPSVPYARRILERLPETTQRSQAEWLGLLAACPFDTLSDRRKWLKTEYDLGGTTANLLAELSFDAEAFTETKSMLPAFTQESGSRCEQSTMNSCDVS